MADESVSEEPGSESPAQTSSTTSESYYPEVREQGEIPIRFFDTTNGQLPSFFYAPKNDLDFEADSPARMKLNQLRSIFPKLKITPVLFVRDNVAGVNHLYNGGPHIYRYHDTCEPWRYSDLEQGEEWKLRWLLENKNSQANEVARGYKADADTQTYVPQSSDAATATFRRVVWKEDLEYEAPKYGIFDLLGFEQHLFTNGFISSRFDFTLCWYKAQDDHGQKDLSELWPSGPLYVSEDPSRRSTGRGFCLAARYPSDENSARTTQRWACYIHTSGCLIGCEEFEKILHEPLLELPLTICIFTSIALGNIICDWQSLLTYMESLVAVHTTIVNPEMHDQLLFDDEQFSRSRLYFWMLSSLATFIHMMEETKLICERLEKYVQELYPDTSRLSDQETKASRAMEPHINSLVQATKRATTLQERVKALRDGLFNASGVLESRAANRLSENVKLLTYVSIFYLPLAFCASLWSTTDTFSWNGLKLAMVLTAVITYLVTFNLNQLVSLSRSVYNVGKKKIVKSMTESENDDWKKRGARFGQFRPPRSKPQPSEWLLLWYLSEAIFAPIWTAVSRLCRAIFSSSDTASSVPHESLAPSHCGSGPQEVKEESITENVTAEALPAEDDAKPGNMTEDAKHSAIDHQTSDADPTPEFQATSGASEQDKNAGSIHTSTASGNLAPTPVVGSVSQPSNTNLPIPGLLRRHSRKAPDLEAGAGATDECEGD
ncbi:hypothetical protein VTO58DRAFT_103072 [Aureobasidium pullulans]